MRLAVLSVLVLAAFSASAQATQSVNLAWIASPSPTVVGYICEYGSSSGDYTNEVNAGNVTNATITGLVQGVTYYFAVMAYDAQGDDSLASNEVNYTVPLSNIPPVVVLTSPAGGASYTAPAAISLGATVTANGHSITNVQFYNGSTLLGASASAPYSFLWTNVSAGSYSLTSVAVYDAGNTVSSSPASVTVTNPPPIVALTSPTSGASYAAPAAISLAASVTANGHSITNVQFYNGSTLLGASASAPYSLLWTNVSAGSYGLTARAVYDAGSTVASSTANVTVTNPPPVVALNSPTNGASYTAPAVISLGANVATNGHSITSVQFYNGTNVLGGSASAPYSFLWTNVSAGSYALTAVATYDAGSTAASSAADVTVTNPPPTIALSSPTNGASYTAPAAISLGATVTANGHSITNVQFYNGSTLLGASASAPYSFLWTNVSAGSYSVTARAIYDAGSTVSSSAANVTVTNPPPMVALTSPTSGASYAAPAVISLAASVTANGHSITNVQFYNGSTLLGASASAPYSLLWTNVSAGSYSLTARAVYDAGSTAASSAASVTVTNPPPVVALSSPTNGASYSAPASVSLGASVTANGHSVTSVQFYNGSTLLGASASAPYSFLWTNVSAGSYSLTAVAVYDAGSTMSSSPVNINVTGLPAPWQTVDIGTVSVAGSACVSNGLYTVNGAGTLSGTADNFRFVYQPLSGSGQIQASLNSVEDTGVNGRIGLMIRESLTSGSEYTFIGIRANNDSFRWQCRSTTGGATVSSTLGAGTPPKAWARMVRTGNMLFGYSSTDGTNWTRVNSDSITMATNIYIGFAVASGASNTLNVTTFTNVSVVP